MNEIVQNQAGLRVSQFAAVLVAFSIVGYPFLAVSTASLGLEGRMFSITLRATVLCLAVVVLVLGFCRKMPIERLQTNTLVLLTLLAYGVRLLSDVMIYPETLGQPLSIYLLFFFGVTLIPTITVLFARHIDTDLAFRLTFSLTAVATLVGFAVARQTIDAERLGKDRAALESLNSISLGNLGVTLTILCLWWLITNWRTEIARRIIAIALLATGLSLTAFAAARGPFVGLFVVVLCLLIRMRGRARLHIAAILGLAAIIGAYYVAVIIGVENLLILRRIDSLTSGSDLSSSIRIQLFSAAIEQIMAHPILGKSIEVPQYKFYPHNMFLEYFMATGMIIGWLIVAFVCLVTWHGLKMLRTGDPRAWVFLIFLQSLTGSMFSGALYASHALWVTAGLTLYVAQLGTEPATRES